MGNFNVNYRMSRPLEITRGILGTCLKIASCITTGFRIAVATTGEGNALVDIQPTL